MVRRNPEHTEPHLGRAGAAYDPVQLGPCESCADDAGQPPATWTCDGLCPRAERSGGDEGCSVNLCDSCADDHLAVLADPEHVPGMVMVDALDTWALAGRILERLRDDGVQLPQGGALTHLQLGVRHVLDEALQDELDLAEECPC